MPCRTPRLATAAPRALTQRGEVRDSYPLGEVRHVRRHREDDTAVRPTIDVITEQRDLRWMFPSFADIEAIDQLAALLREGVRDRRLDAAAVGELPA